MGSRSAAWYVLFVVYNVPFFAELINRMQVAGMITIDYFFGSKGEKETMKKIYIFFVKRR